MSRLELREFPLRRDFPPAIDSGSSFRTSWPEREASRLVDAQLDGVITVDQMRRALKDLKRRDYEAWLAVVLADVQRLSQAEVSVRLNTYPRYLRRLVEQGWTAIAEFLGAVPRIIS
jgi:hypothetical protein